MIGVIASELAEIASDPFVSGWYAVDNPTAPNEIHDLCEGIYGNRSWQRSYRKCVEEP
jgi:Phosphate-induced protein 1 conserved region